MEMAGTVWGPKIVRYAVASVASLKADDKAYRIPAGETEQKRMAGVKTE